MKDKLFFEKLIKVVKKHKNLYDRRDKGYYDFRSKELVWTIIAKECQRSKEECKNRWKLLRERFCKELKKVEIRGITFRPHWLFYDDLYFLKDCITARLRRSRSSSDKMSVLSVSSDYQNFSYESGGIMEPIILENFIDTPPPLFYNIDNNNTNKMTTSTPTPTPTLIPTPNNNINGSTTTAATTTNASTFDGSGITTPSFKNEDITTIMHLYRNLAESLQRVEYKLAELSNSSTKHEVTTTTFQAMDALLLDVPEDLRDEFLAETYQRLMQIRVLARTRLLANGTNNFVIESYDNNNGGYLQTMTSRVNQGIKEEFQH